MISHKSKEVQSTFPYILKKVSILFECVFPEWKPRLNLHEDFLFYSMKIKREPFLLLSSLLFNFLTVKEIQWRSKKLFKTIYFTVH